MKSLVLILSLTLSLILISTAAFAVPGSSTLTCKSSAASGSKQKVEFTVSRFNVAGVAPAHFSVTLNGKKTEFTSTDETKMFGQTIRNAPLGVILVTADNGEDESARANGSFTVTAIPSTVKAYDLNGKLVKWSLQAERDECYDSNGSAKFRSIFRGYMGTKANNGDVIYFNFETQILDCELSYNSGSAC
jgi:hypothetical protein